MTYPPEPGHPLPPPNVPPPPAVPPYGPPAGPLPGAPAARPKNSLAGKITLGVIAVALVVIGVLAWKESHSSPDAAKVGDCVARSGANDIKIVSCTDSTAAYKVVGKVENQTEPAFRISTGRICKPFPAAKSAFWKGKVGSTGYVLCLGPVK
ncbi:LppU/SCO3897 family protein [Actinomadura scrupuli]|uniref:LppU/SCO3897 family protein n=1 Tax=Actinomadura scrupuli TaxID=559629 RepID=UPI003D972201